MARLIGSANVGHAVLLLRPVAADNAAMKAEPHTAAAKSKRRWFQFSLRTLLIFMAVVALACGWLATKIEKKRRERQAVELVLSKGGRVGFDYQRGKTPTGQTSYYGNVEPPGPAWLRSILGENFFSEAEMVFFSDQKPSTLTDAELKSLKELRAWGQN